MIMTDVFCLDIIHVHVFVQIVFTDKDIILVKYFNETSFQLITDPHQPRRPAVKLNILFSTPILDGIVVSRTFIAFSF